MKIIEYPVSNLKAAIKFWQVFGFEVLKKNPQEALLGHLGFSDTLICVKASTPEQAPVLPEIKPTEIFLTIENPYAWHALAKKFHMEGQLLSEAGRGCALVFIDDLNNKIVFQDALALNSQLAQA